MGELSFRSLSPLTLLWFPTTTDKYCCDILPRVKGTMFSRMGSYLRTCLWGGGCVHVRLYTEACYSLLA